ncbi:MAG: NADH-quinone oxidoreductase subunit M [Bdellovibrionaceae bacterium]|jgi:NADH-quinone oxidoreductase subunit M|nr:NADH-quinone oxidoreductase subunit M [Pseudobdellovibrionaceae bacterium]
MLLSLITFLPVVFALMIWFSGSNEKALKQMAIAFTLIEFALSLLLFRYYDPSVATLQLVEQHTWVSQMGVSYFMGLDGISFWLVILTTFLTPITLLGSWTAVKSKTKGFLVCMLLLETSMIGTFLAMDAILFYVFFEVSLIPMYFLVGIWGGANRLYATMKFFIYTMFGSVFMLLAIIFMMFMAQSQLGFMSASLLDFYKLEIPFVAETFFSTQTLLFFAFSLAFAIKVPTFPFHTWLPDAHVQAPTPGSVILAGVMLKMGTYGFLRFVIPMFPQATEHWAWVLLALAVVGIIYGALVAMVQTDMKKLVAYSSVSHMGYVLLGLFALNTLGITGAIYQMLNHGISTGALFLLVGMVYERTHTREISNYGGLAGYAPIFSILFVIVTMSSIAVPMTNGFIGEFLILQGTFLAKKEFVFFAVTGVVLAAAYMLWMVKRVFFGKMGKVVQEFKDKNESLDINAREFAVMLPLIIMIFWMGLFPGTILKWSDTSVKHLVNNISKYELVIHKNSEANKSLYSKNDKLNIKEKIN